jgi:hypothetical protein
VEEQPKPGPQSRYEGSVPDWVENSVDPGDSLFRYKRW